MRWGTLFRIHQTIAAISLVLFAADPAQALWLQVTGETLPVLAPLVVDLEGRRPPPGGSSKSHFTVPPAPRDAPRLRLQYRSDFPRSVTFEADGAVTVDHEPMAGALNLTTRIIISERWWMPQVNASLGEISLDGMTHGRLEAGQTGLRSEWKVKF